MAQNTSGDRIKISFFQLFLLTLAQGGGASIIYLPGIHEAGRDLWLSIIFSSVMGYTVIYFNYLPLSLCPGCSMTQTINKYWGKFIGSFVNLWYFLFFFYLCVLIVADVYYFGKVTMPETPAYVFILFFLTPALYATKLGLETVARFTELLLPIIIITFLSLNVLVIPQLDFQNLLPVMEYGIGPVLEGSLPNLNFPFGQLLPIVFFYKYVVTKKREENNFLKVSFGAIFLITLLLLVRTITSIAAFEINVLRNLTYPEYSVIRLIDIGEVIERVDAILLAIFYLTTFLKFSITFFILCQIISDHFEAGAPKDYSTPMLILIGVSMPFLIPRFNIIIDGVVPYFLMSLPIFLPIPLALYFTIKSKEVKK